MGSTIDGWASNSEIPQSKAAAAVAAFEAIRPGRSGARAERVFTGAALQALPPGVSAKVRASAEPVAFVAQYRVAGKPVFLVAGAPAGWDPFKRPVDGANGSQRLKLLTGSGAQLGSRMLSQREGYQGAAVFADPTSRAVYWPSSPPHASYYDDSFG